MSLSRRFVVSAAAGAVVLVPHAVMAQKTVSDTAKIEAVVITATRVPTPKSKVAQSVTILNGDDLRARSITTVAEALRQVPGAMVVQSGSYGGITSLFLRGGESRYTKVLIDGVTVNTVGGAFYFENLTTDNIDRIEVVRGPGSATYGADAMAGVIQIFTKRGSGKTALTATSQLGSYNTRRGDVSVSGSTPLIGYSLGANANATDGIYAFNNQYRNGGLNGAFNFTPDRLTDITLATRYNSATGHYPTDGDGNPVDSNAFRSQQRLTVSLNATREVARGFRLSLIGTTNEVHDDTEDPSRSGATQTINSTIAKGYRRGAEVRLNVKRTPYAIVTVGTQFERELQNSRNVSGTGPIGGPVPVFVSPDPEGVRETYGTYGALQGTADRLSYDASVRYDHHSDYKNVVNWQTGLNLAVFPQTHVRASYGTAFNAPSFTQSQGNQAWGISGNPDLQPERAHSLNVAIDQELFNGRIAATVGAFDQRFSQLLQFVFSPSGSYYDNLTQARAKGYEAELRALILDNLSASASYTQTIAKVYKVEPGYTGAAAGQELSRRPSHSGTFNLAYAAPSVGSASVTATYVGRRLDFDYSQYPSPAVSLASYVKFDASASLDVVRAAGRTVALTARVENIANKKYQDVFGYRTPGRAVFAGLRFSAGL